MQAVINGAASLPSIDLTAMSPTTATAGTTTGVTLNVGQFNINSGLGTIPASSITLTVVTNPVLSRINGAPSVSASAYDELAGAALVVSRTQALQTSSAFLGVVGSEMGKFTGSAGGGAVLSYADDASIKTNAFSGVAKPAPLPDGRIWAHALGAYGRMKADAISGTPAERSNNFGLATGADTAINPNLRAGLAIAVGRSRSTASSLATIATSVWGQGAAYGVLTDGFDYLKTSVSYGYIDTKSDRTVTGFGSLDTAHGAFGSHLVALRAEVGRKMISGAVGVTPFAAFEPSWLVQNAYEETGSAAITLGFNRTTARGLPATLGIKLDADYALGDMRLTPSATLGWVHNFAKATGISPFFTALPGSNFTVAGAQGDRNLARTEINLEATPNGSTATFYANARADMGARTNAVRGTAGAMIRF